MSTEPLHKASSAPCQSNYNGRVTGKALLATGATLLSLGIASAWQMPWREYPGQDNIEIPPDYQEKTEWQFARLMYPPYPGTVNGRGARGYGSGWKRGRSSWTTDYTAADRH